MPNGVNFIFQVGKTMFFIRTIRYRTQKHPASPERKQGVLLSCMLIVTVKQVHSDAGFCACLFVQGGDMPFHRPLGQEQAVGDLLGAAVRRNHLGEHIPFPFGQPVPTLPMKREGSKWSTCYLPNFSTNRIMIVAHSALAVLPRGSSLVGFSFPVTMPLPTAQLMESLANS